MELEDIMLLSEMSHIQRDKDCMISYMWNLNWGAVTKAHRDTENNTLVVVRDGGAQNGWKGQKVQTSVTSRGGAKCSMVTVVNTVFHKVLITRERIACDDRCPLDLPWWSFCNMHSCGSGQATPKYTKGAYYFKFKGPWETALQRRDTLTPPTPSPWKQDVTLLWESVLPGLGRPQASSSPGTGTQGRESCMKKRCCFVILLPQTHTPLFCLLSTSNFFCV